MFPSIPSVPRRNNTIFLVCSLSIGCFLWILCPFSQFRCLVIYFWFYQNACLYIFCFIFCINVFLYCCIHPSVQTFEGMFFSYSILLTSFIVIDIFFLHPILLRYISQFLALFETDEGIMEVDCSTALAVMFSTVLIINNIYLHRWS